MPNDDTWIGDRGGESRAMREGIRQWAVLAGYLSNYHTRRLLLYIFFLWLGTFGFWISWVWFRVYRGEDSLLMDWILLLFFVYI